YFGGHSAKDLVLAAAVPVDCVDAVVANAERADEDKLCAIGRPVRLQIVVRPGRNNGIDVSRADADGEERPAAYAGNLISARLENNRATVGGPGWAHIRPCSMRLHLSQQLQMPAVGTDDGQLLPTARCHRRKDDPAPIR